jgi:S-adenosylmethionine:tRNA ribosyltransferase-isomerase
MKAAPVPAQRAPQARLLVVDAAGRMVHARRALLADFLQPGDVLVANDAATLPASLSGVHEATGRAVEVRLAGRRSLGVGDVRDFTAVVFGEGDHRTRTEERPPPPALKPGDVLALGPLRATVLGLQGHPRLASLRLEGAVDSIWAGIARHGKPIQYAHVPSPLALWDVWTRVAALPVAFEPPSAGFVLDWALLSTLKARGVVFATLTHAAGISSTGDDVLDARLPFDEPYDLPPATVRAITRAKEGGARVIALGTTVTRALEHAASRGTLRAGPGLADQRLGAATRLRVVDAIVSGTHEPGTSHYELLRAFASDAVLQRASAELDRAGYLTHEFGDTVLIAAASDARRIPDNPGFAGPGGPDLAFSPFSEPFLHHSSPRPHDGHRAPRQRLARRHLRRTHAGPVPGAARLRPGGGAVPRRRRSGAGRAGHGDLRPDTGHPADPLRPGLRPVRPQAGDHHRPARVRGRQLPGRRGAEPGLAHRRALAAGRGRRVRRRHGPAGGPDAR